MAVLGIQFVGRMGVSLNLNFVNVKKMAYFLLKKGT